ncbi:hypothetical protein F4815DRAFT_127854 [Daldinia loculata]|nr:hypothetical protein F4815DRAFT_127854 [Daldinia loculata]
MLRLRYDYVTLRLKFFFFFRVIFTGGFPSSFPYYPRRRAGPVEIRRRGEEPSRYLCTYVVGTQVEAWSCTTCSFMWFFFMSGPRGARSV